MNNKEIAVCAGCILALIIIVLFIVISGYKRFAGRTCEVECPETKEKFVVQNNKGEPEWVRTEVAKRLGRIVIKVDKLVNYMISNDLPDKATSTRLASRWKKIRESPSGLRETGPGEASAAYTVNKGEQMRICIRDSRSDNQFEDENDSFFVILHELAHLMSKSYGHNIEFKNNFSIITRIAVELGLYQYIDYMNKPTNYCNVDITHTAY